MKRLVAAAGCALALTPAIAAPASGWTPHRVPDAGFSVGLPASWLDIGHRTRAVDAKLAKLEAAHPAALVYLSGLKLTANVRFVAVETQGASLARGYPTNVDVYVQSTSLTSVAALEPAVVAGL